MRIRLFEYRYIARMYVKIIIIASRRYLRRLGARRRRGSSPEPLRATRSRPHSGRTKFFVFSRLAAAASRHKTDLSRLTFAFPNLGKKTKNNIFSRDLVVTHTMQFVRARYWKIACYVHRSFVDACKSTHTIVCLIYLTVSQVAMGILMATIIHMGTNRAPAIAQRLRKQIRNRYSPNVSGTRYTYSIACIYRLCVVFPENRCGIHGCASEIRPNAFRICVYSLLFCVLLCVLGVHVL